MAGVDLHGAGDGLEGAVPKVVESLLVQVVLLLAQALLKQLSFVSELDHRLGVGVEGGDGGGHAASEGTPGHAGWRETQTHVVDEWVRRKGRRRVNLFTHPDVLCHTRCGSVDGNVFVRFVQYLQN